MQHQRRCGHFTVCYMLALWLLGWLGPVIKISCQLLQWSQCLLYCSLRILINYNYFVSRSGFVRNHDWTNIRPGLVSVGQAGLLAHWPDTGCLARSLFITIGPTVVVVVHLQLELFDKCRQERATTWPQIDR